MREINVIIEGFSSSGVCVCCLNNNKKMIYNDDTINCYKYLGQINIPEGLIIQLCYECDAILKKISHFQHQIENSYQTLADYASTQAFLQHPNDFNNQAVHRLGFSKLQQYEYVGGDDDVEIKHEPEDIVAEEPNWTVLSETSATENFLTDHSLNKNSLTKKHSSYRTRSRTIAAQENDDKVTIIFKAKNLTILSQFDLVPELEKDSPAFEIKPELEYDELISISKIPISEDNDDDRDEPFPHTDTDEDSISSNEDMGSEGSFEKSDDEVLVDKKKRLAKVNCTEDVVKDSDKSGSSEAKLKSLTRNFNPDAVQAIQASKEEIVQIRQSDVQDPLFLASPHRCVKCFAVFNTPGKLLYHDVSRHVARQYAPCDICHLQMPSRASLKTHTDSHSHYLRCASCEYKTTLSDLMKAHLKQHPFALAKLPVRNVCKANFGSKEELKEHSQQCKEEHVRREDFECEICHRIFHSGYGLKKHMVTHTEPRKKPMLHQCPKCPRQCRKKYDLNEHYKAMHSEHSDTQKYTCQHCGKSTKYRANLQRHLLIHKDKEQNNVFECVECDLRTFSRQHYQHHMKWGRRHRDGNQFQCDHCGKKFQKKTGLKSHIDRQHLNKFLYKSCPVCEKLFPRESALNHHLETKHCVTTNKELLPGATNKSILCDICGKAIRSRGLLRRHKQTHLSYRSFQCDVCHKMFKTELTLYTHKRTHEEKTDKNRCRICGKMFLHIGNMVKHIRTVHAERTIPCEHCGKMFKSTYELKAHTKHVHLKEPWPKRVRNKKPGDRMIENN